MILSFWGFTRPILRKFAAGDSRAVSLQYTTMIYLELQTTIYKWLFQLDDSKPLHGKWLFHQTSMVV